MQVRSVAEARDSSEIIDINGNDALDENGFEAAFINRVMLRAVIPENDSATSIIEFDSSPTSNAEHGPS